MAWEEAVFGVPTITHKEQAQTGGPKGYEGAQGMNRPERLGEQSGIYTKGHYWGESSGAGIGQPEAGEITARVAARSTHGGVVMQMERVNSETDGRVKRRLPPRLFATDRYPIEGRINSYSNAEQLIHLVEILDGTLEMDWLKSSSFGKLFELQIRKCCLSGKLVHQFLSRSLVTRKKHEIWFVFGGFPMRFSLQEFALLTGLNCGPFPCESAQWEVAMEGDGEEDYWHELLGPKDSYSIIEILDMLKADKRLRKEDRMSGGRRLRLSLIVLVDGILTCNSSHIKATRKVVQMVKDLEIFDSYPWGRISFEHTLEMVHIGSKVPSPTALTTKLCHSHTTTHGFTLAIQLLILNTVPQLEQLLPDPEYTATFATCVSKMQRLRTFRNENIIEVEREKTLQVQSILQQGFPLHHTDFSWPDEEDDPRVDYIYSRIAKGPSFRKDEWGGGRSDLPLITESIQKGKAEGKVELKPRVGRKKSLQTRPNARGNDWGEFEEKGASKMNMADEILTEVDRRINEHMTKVQQMFEIEKGILGDELYDRLLRALRPGWGVQTETLSTPTGKTDSENNPQGKERNSKLRASVATDGDDNINAILDSVRSACENTDIGCEEHLTIPEKALDKVGGREIAGESNLETTNETIRSARDEGIEQPVELSDEKDPLPRKSNGEIMGRSDGESEEVQNDAAERAEVQTNETGKFVLSMPSSDGECESGTSPRRREKEQVGREEITATSEEHDANGNVNNKTQESEREKESENETGDADEIPQAEAEEMGRKMGRAKETITNVYIRKRRSKRARKNPIRFGFSETPEKDTSDDSGKKETYSSLGNVAPKRKAKFLATLAAQGRREYAVNGQAVQITFFKEIYKPKGHVDTQHMEAMLSLVWKKIGRSLLEKRVGILDTWFTHAMSIEHGRFLNAKKKDDFTWNSLIRNYVRGNVANRAGELAWNKDIDVVYAPMHWGKGHWVALSINLRDGNILILDCLTDLTEKRKLPNIMKPYVDMLPIIVRDIAPPAPGNNQVTKEFVYKREVNIHKNIRTGDCGPISAKMIELHAQGLTLDAITDDNVDELRLKYAVDVFEEFVVEL